MILISLLVHENLEVILDQIANFRKFAPDSGIVIHPSRKFVEAVPEVPAILAKLNRVWVNPAPLYTGTGMVLKCHISNFLHLQKERIEFSHFCLHASNDLFVRTGVEEYIRRKNYGFFLHDPFNGSNFTNWRTSFRQDRAYRKVMRASGAPVTRYASQVEGTFYPREDFTEFAALFMRFVWRELGWPINYVHGSNLYLVKQFERIQRSLRYRRFVEPYFYTKEEFYPPNFFNARCKEHGTPYCYMNWTENLTITESDVETIRRGMIPGGEYEALFAVKRVSRKMDDPIRCLIRDLAP
jgi:hypothetical protein